MLWWMWSGVFLYVLGVIATHGYLVVNCINLERDDPFAQACMLTVACLWPLWTPFALSVWLWKDK